MITVHSYFILIAITNHSTEAVCKICEMLPDVVILDLELHNGEGSGLTILHELQSYSLVHKPYFLVTTNNSSSITHETARELGADYIMSKHQEGYSEKSVLDFLRILKNTIKKSHIKINGTNGTVETPEQQKRRMIRRITHKLNQIGINPKSIGYTYLIEAIEIVSKEHVSNICNIIAEKHHKSSSSVERAMQNAIERAWKTEDIDTLLQYYTARINPAKGCPTLTEFLYYYANQIKSEY
ncbi:MAG: hypothetical protein IKJ01_04075 [Lachnospiraceae bacterium]|nr:hypothetical protein [Lachnospiraceae bacterium]